MTCRLCRACLRGTGRRLEAALAVSSFGFLEQATAVTSVTAASDTNAMRTTGLWLI